MTKARGLVLFHFVLFTLFLIGRVSGQGSNTCAGALANQISIPYSVTNQSTCGDGNDYTGSNGCIPANGWSNPYGGQDWLYAFTPSQSGIITVSLTSITANGTAVPVMSLFSACPGTANACLSSMQTTNNNPSSLVYQVTAGISYILNIDSYSLGNFYANCFGFNLNIAFSPTVVQPSCSNMGFSNGNLTSWVATSGTSVTAPTTAQTPNYVINSLGVNPGRHTIMTGGNDPCAGFPRVDPIGGPFSVRLGNNNTGAEADQLKQTFLVSSSNSSFTYRYAVVFEDPGHSSNEQPFFRALLRSQDGNVVPCSEFIVSAAASLPGFFDSPSCQGVRYKPWSTVNVDLSNYLGQPVTVEFTAGDCSQGGHFGYAYIDASCAPSTLAELSDTICPGESVTLTAPTGYASYSWQPGNFTQQTITVTPSQTTLYTLGLTAFNGCVSNFQVPIVVSTIPVAAFTFQAPACDLPVQLNATTPGSNNTYVWNLAPSGTPASSSQQVVNASFPGPGSYPVDLTVTNSTGCTNSISQNVIVPPCEFRIAITGDTLCPGNCMSLTPSIAFGTPPYSYLWSNGSTGTSINVCASQSTLITLTMTDADGAIATDTAMITIVPASQIVASLTNLSCFESTNGEINTNVIGWGPFTYAWSSGESSSGLTGLSAGSYSVSVSDRFGCITDSLFAITQPQPLIASSLSVAAQCGMANGEVAINQVSGGTPSYTYNFNGLGPTSVSVFSNLAPGSYSTVVTDMNSCSTTVVTNVGNLSMPVSMQVSLQNATCGLSNGQMSIQTIQGGFSPYTFSINNGNSGSLFTPLNIPSLSAGNYLVAITDSLGCTIDSSFTINQLIGPSALAISLQSTTCSLDNGSLTITNVVDGSPSYLYSINSGIPSAITNYTNLAAGNYVVEVIDQNQCSFDTTVQLLAIPSLQIQAFVDAQVLCYGGSNGTGHVDVISGANPVSFQWSNGVSGSIVSSLTSGSYFVIASDANNCVDTSSILVTQPEAISFSETLVNPICGLASGSIQINEILGGVAPFQFRYNISAWGNSSSFSQLSAGSYSVWIRDANACVDSVQLQLIMPSYPTTMNTSIVDAVCDDNNARLSLNSILGGVPPFQYYFNDSVLHPLSQFPMQFAGLDEGLYPIGIRDANGCSIDSSRLIVRYLGPNAMVISSTDATCSLSNSAISIQNVLGGTQPYTYSINGQNASFNQFSSLAPGQYLLAATDANGCIVDSLVQTLATPTVSLNTLIVHPITCYGYSDGELMANITSGVAPFDVSWSNGQAGNAADSLSAGLYTATVIDSNGCSAIASFTMPQPPPVLVDITGPPYVCENSTVNLNASASGGTDHLDIAWIGFSHLGESLSDLPTNSRFYHVRASDIFGCNATDSTYVLLRTNPSGTLDADVSEGCAPVCVNFSVNSTGSANLTSYAWSFNTGQFGSNPVQKTCFSQSGSPEVSVFLTDEFGCSSTLSASGLITVYPLPDAKFAINPNHADIINPVYRLINQSSLADTYFWTFGDGQFSTEESPIHQYPDTGSYQVCLKVSTSFGCEDFACKTLEIDPAPTIYAPNAFTPNADGTNDRFVIKLTYVDKFLLEIFDRWGELIYASNDPNDGWDGTYKQNKVQEDVYVWRVTYTNMLQKHGQLIGRVTLIE